MTEDESTPCKTTFSIRKAYADAISKSISFLIALTWNGLFQDILKNATFKYAIFVIPLVLTVVGSLVVAGLSYWT
jgi:hypothetical protein